MIMNWLRDTGSWFAQHWVEWIAMGTYIGILYWTASHNWQVTHFPVFFAIFVALSILLLVVIRAANLHGRDSQPDRQNEGGKHVKQH